MKLRPAALALLLLVGCNRAPALNIFGKVPEFSLIASDSKPITRNDLQGKVWIADFIFTHCAGTCPEMSGIMRKLQDRLPPEVTLVSFSVDPVRDTAEELARYGRDKGADPKRWLFVTGERAAMYALCRDGFKLAVDDTQGTEAEPITHSSRFALVDQKGQIRGYFGLEDPATPDALDAAARSLL